MKFTDFKIKFQNLPLLPAKDMARMCGNSRTMHNQIYNWQKKGLLIKLRRGLYLLRQTDRKINPSKHFLASQLYTPSYISMEYALSHYGIIPERTVSLTSVTPKKTAKFDNTIGAFTYQTIALRGFKGFKSARDESGLTFFIAEPEKAIIDFIYLNLSKFKRNDSDIFADSYRFQNLEIINTSKLLEFAKLFKNTKLFNVAKNLTNLINRENPK